MTLRDRLRLAFRATPVPVGEIGIANPQMSVTAGFRWSQYNPDAVVGRKGLQTYDLMRHDEQIKACFALKKGALLGPGWQVRPAADYPAAIELADEVNRQLQNLEGCFEQDVAEMLSAMAFGFSITELVYEIEAGTPTLRKLKTLSPFEIEFAQDPLGNVLEIRQRVGAGAPVTLPPEKFIHLVWAPEFANPYGQSDLRAVYRSWWHKINWIQWLALWGEQLADAPKVAKHPPQTTAAKIETVLANLQALQANAAIAVPIDWELSLLESTKNPRQGFLDVIDHWNAAVGKGLLTPDKIGMVGGEVRAGSYALAKTQFGGWMIVVEQDRKYVANVIQEQLIDRLASYLDATTEPPQFEFLPITEDITAQLADLYIRAVNGNIILPDLQDENDFRQWLKLTEVDEARAAAMEQARRDRVAEQMAIQQVQASPPPPADARQQAAERHDLAAISGVLPTARDAAAPVPRTYWRTLRPLEERADMAEKLALFEERTAVAGAGIADALEGLVDDLRTRAARALKRGTVQAVAALEPAATRTQAVSTNLGEALVKAYEKAGRQAKAEIRRARKA